MAQVMNNMELTRGFEALQTQVNDLAARLATAIPEIKNKLRIATVDTQNMHDSIRSVTMLAMPAASSTLHSSAISIVTPPLTARHASSPAVP